MFVCVALYLGLYTWNARTQALDRFAAYTGLEFVGWVVKPGVSVHSMAKEFWERYVYLVEVHQENRELRQKLDSLKLQLAAKSEKAALAERLEDLLEFTAPPGWSSSGLRVVGHNYGPLGVLDSVIVDKGRLQGISPNMPVVAPEGVLGRTFKIGLNFSTVLLLSDHNSRIPVVSSRSRTPGIIAGQGQNKPLAVKYVHLNAPLQEGEHLVTSGTAGIYPKGLPVARVSRVERSQIRLFQLVEAEKMVSAMDREEVMVLDNITKLRTDYLDFEGIIWDYPQEGVLPEEPGESGF